MFMIDRRRFLSRSILATLSGGMSLSVGRMLRSASAFESVPTPPTVTSLPPALATSNPVIDSARLAGLKLLQPTAKQLEHGLALHTESVVFDSYGFAPRANLDNDRIAEALEQGASDLEIQDLTEDMSMTRPVTDLAERREFLEAFKASGVTCIFQNAGEEGQGPLMLIKRLARFTFLTDHLREHVSRAVVPEDIEAAKKAGRHCLYLTGNGVPLTEQWVSVEDELRYLRIFSQLGIRMMHLTYQRRNMIGDGAAETANAGLSDFGRHVVAEMNKLGLIVDVAHSGWKTSLEAAKISKKPIVASHTACASLHRHIRGKPDEVIRAIVDGGGLVGICCIPSFLGGKGGLNDFLNHIDHVVKKFGPDHVAIGTDIAYSSRNRSIGTRKMPPRRRARARFAALWPADALSFPVGKSERETLAWTNWPLFTVGLVQRGHSDETIRKILSGNMLRVCREVLRTASLPEANKATSGKG